jgi:pantoate--beta-alanine ligase
VEVITTATAMQQWTTARRAAGLRIGLVPTMGALHEGHFALVERAAASCDVVVVSIFVNPLQFNRADDFDAYPRPIDDDLAMCRDHGVAAVYAPTAAAMYPAGFETTVEPGSLAEPLEGAGRPGHFRGVTTVVTKLFNAVRPDEAVFGRKDFQQLAIIKRMALDLDMGIEVVALDTVRESDGLAMSSRNRRLTAAQRAAAICVPQALAAAADRLATGERLSSNLLAAAHDVLHAEPMARLEYVAIVDPDTLQPVDEVGGDALIVTAVWFGEVRLIDNRLLQVVERA